MNKKVAVTFDLDFIQAQQRFGMDEIEMFWPMFQQWTQTLPELKTTWFIRIDDQINSLFGSPDYFFKKHPEKIEWLNTNGHEIGWHFHSYTRTENKWKQNTNENAICEELKRNYYFAEKQNLQISRMGWGYHTNATMRILAESGIVIDSSALPVVNEKDNRNHANWTNTPHSPYHPSMLNYRESGTANFDIWELPITMVNTNAKEQLEKRIYLDINSTEFSSQIDEFDTQNIINTLSHPIDVLNDNSYTKDMSHLGITNMRVLQNRGYRFVSLSDCLE